MTPTLPSNNGLTVVNVGFISGETNLNLEEHNADNATISKILQFSNIIKRRFADCTCGPTRAQRCSAVFDEREVN